MKIAELSLKRPVTTTMVFVTLLVIGIIAALRLPLEFMPSIDPPFLFVDLPYPGSTPEEVERTITRPAEEALATLTGIKQMNSSSRSEGANIFIQFSMEKDVAIAASEARERLDAIRDELPSDFRRYLVQKFSSGDQAVLRIRLAGNKDLVNAYDIVDKSIRKPLERLPGVARVDISGILPNEVEIQLQADRISAHNISLNELSARLSAANFSTSAGEISDGGQRFRVQPVGEIRDLEELRNLPINDQGLRLKDIAKVSLKSGKQDFRRHLDLKPAVGIDIFKERNANLVEVGRIVLDEVNKISKSPELGGIELYVLSNQAEGVTSSLMDLAEAGFIGSIMSIFVLFFFLRHWPSTLAVSMAVPICFVITLGMMYFFGVSLNVLSMMGLLLGVGMVVDNAVVAVESVFQEREKMPHNPAAAAVKGIRNVGIALSAGTLSHCIVFLPNIMGEKNFISIYLAQVAIAITISLLASWLVAISLIPMLAARMKPPEFLGRDSSVSRFRQRYKNFLGWSLQNRGKTMSGVLVLILLSMIPASFVKYDMFPSGQTRELELGYRINGSYDLDEMDRSISRIEKYLLDNKDALEIRSVYSWFSDRGFAGTQIMLHEDERADKSVAVIQEEILKGLPKIAIGEVSFGEERRGNSEGLRISIIGSSNETLTSLRDTIVPILRRVEGLRDVTTDDANSMRELAVRVDRERAATYGFSAREVAQYIGIALRGTPLREFRTEQGEVPVWMRFQDSDSQSIENLNEYKLKRADGQFVSLMSLVDIKMVDSASTIQRQGRQTSMPVKINLKEDTTAEEARKRIDAALKPIVMPAGYSWSFGGGFMDADEAGKQMGFNMLIALLMIYVVMAAVFESLLFPAAILTTILFSILGVLWLFWLTGTTFSIMATIGILILMGVVVNNGIVLVEHINQLRLSGLSRSEALIQGSADRLRPVLMTVGTTILGMLPLCLGNTQIGGDGPPYYPMARAIVGGLFFSTIVTLAVLPTIYAILDDWRIRSRLGMQDAKGWLLPKSRKKVIAPVSESA